MSTLLPKCKVGAGVVDCLSGVATPGTVSEGAAPPPAGVVVVVTICLSVCLANIPAFSSPDLAVFYVKYCTKAYCRLWAT